MKPRIILASTSTFRQAIFQKLHLPFESIAPNCDETPYPEETAENLVKRLSETKARSCKVNREHALIIGSDQVCVVNNQIIGKPHTRENAIKQLTAASGKAVTFYTGLSLYNTLTDHCQTICEPFTVHFRTLSIEQIHYYVDKEQPLNCAGSFMCEGLGIALFERLEGKDPNCLIGLPLISLVDLFETEGITTLS
jgi:MAF protein